MTVKKRYVGFVIVKNIFNSRSRFILYNIQKIVEERGLRNRRYKKENN